MKFENWMIGKEVVEISTGDRGEVVGQYLPENGAYIYWTTGRHKGYTLWLHSYKFVFVDSLQDSPSIEDKLTQIEKLLSEVKQLLKEVNDTV